MNVERILSIHHMLAMGEVILLSAPFNAIRAGRPGTSVSLAAGRYACGFLNRMPWVEQAVPIERFGLYMNRASRLKRVLARPFIAPRLSGYIRRRRFDTVFIRDDARLPYTRLIRTAVEQSGVRKIISLQPLMEKHLRHSRHVVDGYYEILTDLGFDVGNKTDFKPVLVPEEPARTRAVEWLSRNGINPSVHKLIGLCPTSNLDIKNWRAERTAGLHRLVSGDPSIRILLFTIGGAYARRVTEILPMPPVIVGERAFDDLVALISFCKVFVSVDTGPLHAAAALGIPSIGIFGPTSGTMFGPYGSGHTVLQNTQKCPFYRPQAFFSSQNGDFQECYVFDKCRHLPEPCTNQVTEHQVVSALKGFIHA